MFWNVEIAEGADATRRAGPAGRPWSERTSDRKRVADAAAALASQARSLHAARVRATRDKLRSLRLGDPCVDVRRSWFAVATTLMLLSISSSASAQLAPPNQAGVSMGHLHYQVRDVEANARFWEQLGGTRVMSHGAFVLKFPDVLVFLTQGESEGGTEGSVVNHVAFRVPSLSTVEAAGLKVARLANFPGVASVTSPEGERVELFENAATNLTFTQDPGHQDAMAERHNRPLTAPVAFHHIHLYLPSGQVAAAKAWYVKVFGGIPGKRWNYDAVDLPGINLNFSEAPRPAVPLRGRRLDHVGLEVQGLQAFCQRLQSIGLIFDIPYAKDAAGIGRARLTDPWGTSIELTEGLRGV